MSQLTLKQGKKVHVVVPMYNDWEGLRRLFSSFVEARGDGAIELTVVDNDSSDEAPSWLAEIQREINLHVCREKGSYSARNYGLRFVDGDIIVFTDSDCELDSGYFLALREFYSLPENEHALMAGAVSVQPSNPRLVGALEAYDCVLGLPQKRYVSKGYAVTANLAVPATVFEEIGFFDEKHFSGGDAEFCRRAVKANFKLKYNGEAVVKHPARREFKEFRKKISRVIGAQIGRAGTKGKLVLLFSIFLFPAISWLRILMAEKPLPLRMKAFLAVPVLSLTRFYYYLYHLLPFSHSQR